MSLAAPLALATAVLAAPLVLWYVLRSRHPRTPVASTLLWRRTDRSVSAAVPWQRFRPDTVFWLLLVALLLGALALARPYRSVPAELGDHTVLIMDASGSMLADEEGPTRLTLARRRADELVGALGPGQVISVVEAGSRPRVLLSASDDRSAVRDALAAVEPTHGPAELDDAFTLAASLQRPGQRTVLHLLTDGRVPERATGAAPEDLQVTAVGQPRGNLAVTRLQALPRGGSRNQVLVQVRNLGTAPAAARLTLAVDGQQTVTEGIDLGPRATADRVLGVPGQGGQILSATVAPAAEDTGTAVDALQLDDRAVTVLSAPTDVQVTLATPGNVFLRSALEALPRTEVATTGQVPDDLSDTDVLVVDRLPAPARPPVATLLVAPTRWPSTIAAAESVDRPAVTFQDTDHPVLADVDLSGVAVAAATPLTDTPLQSLAAGPDGPLIAAGRLGSTPTVAVGFDLQASNLPLQPTWPVLVANTVAWLAQPPTSTPAIAGERVRLPVPPDAARLEVVPPSGATVHLDPAQPRLIVDEVGTWQVAPQPGRTSAPTPSRATPPPGPDRDTIIAVNAAPGESDLARPRPEPPTAGGDGQTQAAGPAGVGRRRLAPAFLAGVLALMVGEWMWTHALGPWIRRRRRAP